MGVTQVVGEVSGPLGTRTVKFLVDSGATYTLLPREVWQAIGLRGTRQIVILLADGSERRRAVGSCDIRLPQGETRTPAILGEAGDHPLLGAVTLEEIGLILDPFNRTLHPMRILVPAVGEARIEPITDEE